MAFGDILISFIVSLVISAVIIFLAAKLFGEKEGFGTAILAALIGTVIYSIVIYFLGVGWIAALIGAVAWLIALGSLYEIGWLKSLAIAVVIWIFMAIVSLALPTTPVPI
ncbi:MAG TPA: hypothetical protein VEC16_01940 [Alphaproteobacteria bacterium]|nr:hypothetical protein [Alphaproteobacteria bacterium]